MHGVLKTFEETGQLEDKRRMISNLNESFTWITKGLIENKKWQALKKDCTADEQYLKVKVKHSS